MRRNAVLACEAVARQHPQAIKPHVPALEDRLDDPVERVRQAVVAVLRTVTGTGTKVFRPDTALSGSGTE